MKRKKKNKTTTPTTDLVEQPSKKFQPVTQPKMAEIKCLDKSIKSYSSQANQLYILPLAIGLTAVLHYLLFGEKGILRKEYLNQIDELVVYLFLNNEDISVYHELQRKKNGIKEIKKIVYPNCVQNLINSQDYLQYNHTALVICRSILETLVKFSYKNISEIIGPENLIAFLSPKQAFDTAKQILDYLDEYEYYFPDLESAEMLIRYTTLLNLNTVTALLKTAFITIGSNFIIPPLFNLVFPRGCCSSVKTSAIDYKKLLVTSEKDADILIAQLKSTEKQSKNIAERNNKYLKYTYLFCALACFLLLLAFGPNDVPGELVFCMFSVAASALFHGCALAKKTFDNYYLESNIKAALDAINKNFPGIIQAERDSQLSGIHYDLIYINKYKNIPSEHIVLMLERCLNSQKIKVVYIENKKIVIAHDSKIQKVAKQLKQQFDEAINSYLTIQNTNKKLLDLQKLLTTDVPAVFSCDKFFDDKGHCGARWSLLSPSKNTTEKLIETIGKQNCTVEKTNIGFIIEFDDTVSQNITNISHGAIIQLVKEPHANPSNISNQVVTKPIVVDDKKFEDKQQETPTSLKTSNKHSPLSITQSITETTTTSHRPEPKALQTLPGYPNARPFRSAIFSSNKPPSMWACFNIKKEQFPTEECYQRFSDLFTDPTIVGPKNEQGFVYDEEYSRRSERHYKAKLLGDFGMFRVVETESPKVITFNGEKHTIHKFNALENRH